MIADLPRSLNAIPAAALNAPPAPFVPVEHHHKPGYALLLTGTYLNALSEQDDHRIRVSYGAKYDRLADVKGKYDPGNVFHRNANIKSA